jgi:hypothetical protein
VTATDSRSTTLRHRAILFLPLMVGFCLRFYSLGKQALFLDEAFSADLVLRPWGEMVRMGFRDVHPLLFYSLLKIAMSCLPLVEWTLRLVPAVCSTLSLVVTMGIARRLAGSGAAMWAGWTMAWSSLHLYYAQDVRMYTLLELLWLLSPWLLLRALHSSTWLLWIGWALATGAAVHTHFYGLLLWAVGAIGSGASILVRCSWQEFRFWAVSQFIVAAIALPLAVLLVSTVRQGVGGTWVPSWQDPFDLWFLVLFGFSPVPFHFLNGNLMSLSPWNTFSRSTWFILALLITGEAIIGWRHIWLRRDRRWTGWWVFTFGLLPILSATLLLRLTHQRFWAYRPFIGAVIWLLIGLAIGWSALPRRISWAVLGLLFALNLGPIWAYETQWIKDYGRTAFRNWSEEVSDETPLVLDRYYISYVWNFYRSAQGEMVFGIAPQQDGSFGLMRVVSDGTLRGRWEVATCDDLPAQSPIGLYDHAGRRFGEGDRWPSCLRGRSGWIFDPQTGHWEEVSQLLP